MAKAKICLLFLMLYALSGCATRHGIPIPGAGTSKAEVREFHKRFEKVSEHAAKREINSAIAKANESQFASPRILVIGYTMGYRKYDSDDIGSVYKDVVKDRKHHDLSTDFDKNWFEQNVAGDTAVQYWNIPLVLQRFMPAFVSKDVEKKIEFPSSFMSANFGSKGDLVVAIGTKDYGTWILRALCKRSEPNFSECSANYHQGLFQASDGFEIGTSFELVSEGRSIDPHTFLAIRR